MKEKLTHFVEAQLVFLLAALWLIWFQFVSPYLLGFDAFYHMKVSLLMRLHGVLYEFPWTELSTWKDSFSDKDFLFHVFLVPFTYFDDLELGGKYAVVVFAALVLTSVFSLLRRYKVSYAALWALLLPLMSIDFFYRMSLTRPHILGVLFLLWIVFAVIEKRLLLLAFLSFFFPWAHTSYALPVVWIGALAFVSWLFSGPSYLKPLLVSFVVTLLGTIVHPYFPDNWQMFWVQNIVVMQKGLGTSEIFHLGRELGVHTTKVFLLHNIVSLLLTFSTVIVLASGKVKLTEKHKAWCWFAFFAFGMTLLMRRFAEIWAPINLIASLQILIPFVQEEKKHLSYLRGAGFSLLLFLVVGGGFWLSYRTVQKELVGKPPFFKEAAQFFEEHSEPGELIFTCDWDDASGIFFFNHKNHYLVMLDPTFAMQYDEKKATRWRALALGKAGGE
ncbi:MAG: hypothetical protein KDD55_12940, partial [Bdellovibrionales bacterium]|nr:hypothetical protein [Bdellovibrionales bacterium]